MVFHRHGWRERSRTPSLRVLLPSVEERRWSVHAHGGWKLDGRLTSFSLYPPTSTSPLILSLSFPLTREASQKLSKRDYLSLSLRPVADLKGNLKNLRPRIFKSRFFPPPPSSFSKSEYRSCIMKSLFEVVNNEDNMGKEGRKKIDSYSNRTNTVSTFEPLISRSRLAKTPNIHASSHALHNNVQ